MKIHQLSKQLILLVLVNVAILSACNSLGLVSPTETAAPTVTSTFTPMATTTPTDTPMPLPPTEAPIPTPTRPNPPENLKIEYTCTKTKYGQVNRSQSILFEISIKITWEDKSNNEIGFEIYKGNDLLKTLDTDVTTTMDVLQSNRPLYGSLEYTVLAFNNEGKSARVKGNLHYNCQ